MPVFSFRGPCLGALLGVSSLTAVTVGSIALALRGAPGAAVVSAGCYLLIFGACLVFSGAIGALVAKFAQANSPERGALYGLTTWAIGISALAATALVSTWVLLPSVIATGTAASAGLSSMLLAEPGLEEVAKLNPRVVSDVKILKGKVTSEVQIDPPKPRTFARIYDKMRQEWNSPATQRSLAPLFSNAMTARKTVCELAGLLFWCLIISGVAATAGGLIVGRSGSGRIRSSAR